MSTATSIEWTNVTWNPITAPGAKIYGRRGVVQPLSEKDGKPDDWNRLRQ